MNTSYSPAGASPQPIDWIAQLTRLVRALHRSDIRSVAALIGKLLDDPVAATMALKLLYWIPKATRPGGWVYKSWRDWAAECNLSQAQVKRIHSRSLLERIGFARATFKANGCPTTHYRLEADTFINQLAAFLEVTPVQVRLWMTTEASPSQVAIAAISNGSEAPVSNGENRPMEMAETAKSITDSDKQESTQERQTTGQHQTVVVEPDHQARMQPLLDALVCLGIGPTRASLLVAGYTDDQINQALRLTERVRPYNPAGYLIRALEGEWIASVPPCKQVPLDGRRYVTGPYAHIIGS
ncbi:MAG: hypothetical protein J0M33_09710 [Anaerolineae bacterium]|nr:hypothetical protein [Anaerolineae bacterium]